MEKNNGIINGQPETDGSFQKWIAILGLEGYVIGRWNTGKKITEIQNGRKKKWSVVNIFLSINKY